MRKKSDEQILGEVKAEILRMFGTEKKAKATREKIPLFYLRTWGITGVFAKSYFGIETF